jgi:predicted DNA-binding transcriptional regulator AlpA
MEWSVLVETKAPEDPESLDDDQVMELLEEVASHLIDFSVAASGDHRGWSVRLYIETDVGPNAAVTAVETGSERVRQYAEKVGLPMWPVVRTEAVESDTFHAELEVSNFPNILGTTEVTEMLGVSRQRLHELRSLGRFPEPMVELAATPLWIRSTVDSFLAGWSRKPGRPSKNQELLGENDQIMEEIGEFGGGRFGESDIGFSKPG